MVTHGTINIVLAEVDYPTPSFWRVIILVLPSVIANRSRQEHEHWSGSPTNSYTEI
jgi:hypothetical protein